MNMQNILLTDYLIKMKEIDLGTWTESSYYYNETCDDCGYKSIDYANYFGISYNDFESLDDYDGFRWQELENKIICEVCYKIANN